MMEEWAKYLTLIRELGQKIKKSSKKFDCILCIGRGGFLIGDALSRFLKLPLSVIMTSSYDDERKVKEKLLLSTLAFIKPLRGHVLIVDDMVDSGETLLEVEKFLKNSLLIRRVSSAVIWRKQFSKFIPNFYIKEVEQDDWIVQPFETLMDGL